MHGKIPALQPTLPTGFDSWTQVFTDWRVSRAFEASPYPRCLADQPELAAPFVAEIGRAIRDKQLRCRPVELAIHREAVVEPAYERSGGAAYVALRQAMESAQENYVAQLRGNTADGESAGHGDLRTEVERLQSAFFASRQRHEPVVAQARRASVQDYWAKNQPRGMDDTFFADAPTDSAPVRMSRIDPGWWWRSFFTHLQQEFAKHHSADGCFLDAASHASRPSHEEDACRAHRRMERSPCGCLGLGWPRPLPNACQSRRAEGEDAGRLVQPARARLPARRKGEALVAHPTD